MRLKDTWYIRLIGSEKSDAPCKKAAFERSVLLSSTKTTTTTMLASVQQILPRRGFLQKQILFLPIFFRATMCFKRSNCLIPTDHTFCCYWFETSCMPMGSKWCGSFLYPKRCPDTPHSHSLLEMEPVAKPKKRTIYKDEHFLLFF